MPWLLVRGVHNGQGLHSIESMLTEFRALVASNQQLSFYSAQRSWRQRPRNPLHMSANPPSVLHLEPAISSVSDNYLQSVLEDYYFNSIEPWAAQHI